MWTRPRQSRLADPLVPASPGHAPALALLHARAFPPAERWSAEAFAAQLGVPGTFGFIDGRGGFVLARCTADEAEILTLAVDPAARRQGTGRALLGTAIACARVRGASAMLLEVAAANDAALALYAAAGFSPVGRRPRYYPGGADALILRRAI